MSHIVLVVVPDHVEGGAERRYLIVEERDGTFFLPAGRVEPNENLMAAAVRETAEEAGLLSGLQGILGIEHEPHRMRFCFVGYAAVDMPPKSRPDRHSRGARWLTKAEIARMPLRHPEVLDWIERAERATALLPCAAYQPHGLSVPSVSLPLAQHP
jgi:8-oxo-dGTP pyrophosphatase MutT (NUDIX family)